MVKKNKIKTAAYILLDASGSMQSMWEEALGSINGYVKGLPEDSRVIVAAFDTNRYEILRDTVAGDWKILTGEEIYPMGGTPLFDSSARMMWRIKDDRPDRAVFVTMTDGEENASKHFRQADVKNLVKELEAKDYQVVFLGANFDKVGDVATQYGVNATRGAFNMAKGSFTPTMVNLSAMSTNYMTTGVSINTADLGKPMTATIKTKTATNK